jgi:hypothetical protein
VSGLGVQSAPVLDQLWGSVWAYLLVCSSVCLWEHDSAHQWERVWDRTSDRNSVHGMARVWASVSECVSVQMRAHQWLVAEWLAHLMGWVSGAESERETASELVQMLGCVLA